MCNTLQITRSEIEKMKLQPRINMLTLKCSVLLPIVFLVGNNRFLFYRISEIISMKYSLLRVPSIHKSMLKFNLDHLRTKYISVKAL